MLLVVLNPHTDPAHYCIYFIQTASLRVAGPFVLPDSFSTPMYKTVDLWTLSRMVKKHQFDVHKYSSTETFTQKGAGTSLTKTLENVVLKHC